MAQPPLQLLGHGVDIAEAALQRMVLEDRGGAGGRIGEVYGLACLVDGMGCGHPDRDPLLDRDGRAVAEILPDIGHRLQYEAARGAEIDFGLRQPGLNNGVVAQWALVAASHLVARQIDEAIKRAAGDAAGDAGKTNLVAGAGAHAIKRTALPTLPVEFTGDRVVRSNEEVIQGELVAGGA